MNIKYRFSKEKNAKGDNLLQNDQCSDLIEHF